MKAIRKYIHSVIFETAWVFVLLGLFWVNVYTIFSGTFFNIKINLIIVLLVLLYHLYKKI
jgi:hypothetical protein